MNITRLVVGPIETNCFIVSSEGECVVVDPGAEPERIRDACSGTGAQPVAILCTHGHADHIGAVAELKAAWPDAVLCISEHDSAMLRRPLKNLSVLMNYSVTAPPADRLLVEGDRVAFGERELRVMETPGHTAGGLCLVADAEDPAVVFCGDLIFRQGVGRTDLPGGDADQLRHSIQERILTLPGETILLPGHGPSTTVDAERDTLAFAAF